MCLFGSLCEKASCESALCDVCADKAASVMNRWLWFKEVNSKKKSIWHFDHCWSYFLSSNNKKIRNNYKNLCKQRILKNIRHPVKQLDILKENRVKLAWRKRECNDKVKKVKSKQENSNNEKNLLKQRRRR